MRAIAFDNFGKSPSVHELPVPDPAAGELRVRVQASSLNAFDVLVANGSMKGRMEHRFPLILGSDFAGVVDAAGPAVSRFRRGDPVFGVVSKPFLGGGAFADFVNVSESVGVTRRADRLPLSEAGALGLAGVTAHLTVEALALVPGETVLIVGATGGVGSLAVQMAVARGARVIATARHGHAEYVRDLGAAETVDPTGIPGAVRKLAPGGVQAVAHLAGDARELATLVAPGGRFASTLGVGPDQLAGLPLKATAIMAAMPPAELLDRLAKSVVEGKLRVPILRTCSLDEVPQALKDFSSGGKLGKVAVAVAR